MSMSIPEQDTQESPPQLEPYGYNVPVANGIFVSPGCGDPVGNVLNGCRCYYAIAVPIAAPDNSYLPDSHALLLGRVAGE